MRKSKWQLAAVLGLGLAAGALGQPVSQTPLTPFTAQWLLSINAGMGRTNLGIFETVLGSYTVTNYVYVTNTVYVNGPRTDVMNSDGSSWASNNVNGAHSSEDTNFNFSSTGYYSVGGLGVSGAFDLDGDLNLNGTSLWVYSPGFLCFGQVYATDTKNRFDFLGPVSVTGDAWTFTPRVNCNGGIGATTVSGTNGVYVFSPSGARWRIKVDNAGVLSTANE
jgi:hypothetical protein